MHCDQYIKNHSSSRIPLTILNVILIMFYFFTFMYFFGHTDEYMLITD